MSSPHNTPPPKAARGKHQHSKSATHAPPNSNGKQSRRSRGNRANNAQQGNAQYHADVPGNKLSGGAADMTSDTAVLSTEEAPIPTGPRGSKKQPQSQPSSDRVVPPPAIPSASLTDSELPPSNPAATPAKAQGAYAGPTFHASPAPSALPIPKFLSKSVPKSQGRPPTPPDEESDSASSPTPSPPSPSRAPISVPSRQEDSPLDILFRADRAEKSRNANGSPASVLFSSPNQPLVDELDAESKVSRPSPPLASPVAHRSITAPSKIPQMENTATNTTGNKELSLQDLFNKVALKQAIPANPTPPKTVDRIPSEPSSRYHTPSPFYDGRSALRSSSNPATPAPAPNNQESDFFYGNQRNLSPLFKAAKTDSTKRNSGLRTEITVESPTVPQGSFPPTHNPAKMDANAVAGNFLQNLIGPTSPRRGSAPQIPPFQEMPSQRKAKTPNRRSYHSRPDSYTYANANTNRPTTKTNPISLPKSTTTMAFVPASVQAKQHSTAKKSPPVHASLEQELDLKRLLNISDVPGVR